MPYTNDLRSFRAPLGAPGNDYICYSPPHIAVFRLNSFVDLQNRFYFPSKLTFLMITIIKNITGAADSGRSGRSHHQGHSAAALVVFRGSLELLRSPIQNKLSGFIGRRNKGVRQKRHGFSTYHSPRKHQTQREIREQHFRNGNRFPFLIHKQQGHQTRQTRVGRLPELL